MGLGANKECYERGAYLAHMLANNRREMPRIPETLYPKQSRYDLETVKLPDCGTSPFAVVWGHAAGPWKVWCDEDEAKARQRFEQLKGGPYSTALFGSNGHWACESQPLNVELFGNPVYVEP